MENENINISEETELNEEVAGTDYEGIAAKVKAKCAEAQDACRGAIDRIARDLKETDYNPTFRQTRTYKLEVFRSDDTETPVDVFETEESFTFSARALAIAGGATVALMFAADRLLRKLGK